MASGSSSSSRVVVTWGDVDSLDRGHGRLAIVAESSDSETVTVDIDRMLVVGSDSFKYDRPDGCRVDHPKDKYLISFLKRFNVQGKWDLFLVRKVDQVLLAGRDSLTDFVTRGRPMYLLGEPRKWSAVLSLQELTPQDGLLTRAPEFIPARWNETASRVDREKSYFGLFLAPLKCGVPR